MTSPRETPPPPTKQADEIYCTSCRAVIKREAEICVHCGVRVGHPAPGAKSLAEQSDEVFCPSCRAVIKREAEICVHCGVRVQARRGAPRAVRRSATDSAAFHPADAIGLLGVLLVITAVFLPWYDLSFEAFDFSVSVTRRGWQSPGAGWSIMAAVFAVLFLGTIVARFIEDIEDTEALEYAPVATGIACVAVVLGKLSAESSFLAIGFYLALVGALALAGSGAVRLASRISTTREQ